MKTPPAVFRLILAACLAFAGLAAAQDPLPYDELPPDRVLYVAPGQNLDELVRKAYPDRPDRWAEIHGWIVDHNPHAFIDGDPARLLGDVRLRLPHASSLAERQSPGFTTGDEPGFRLVFDERFLFVDPAQSLAELIPRVYPNQQSRWDNIIASIQENNAKVLEARDAERTIARGTRLRIPRVVETNAAGEPRRKVEPQPIVARLLEATGPIEAIDAAGRPRALETGSTVRLGDVMETGADAAARIEFEDGERLRLRADSHARVSQWSLPDVGPGQRVIELLAGGLRAVTGAIGNRDGDDYRTVTPTATLGVRGTDYALRLCDSGECRDTGGGELPGGLYVGVAAGEVELLNAGGEVRLGAGEYGFVASSEVAPERIDMAAATAVYTADELDDEGRPEPLSDADGAEDDGPSWWWGAGLLLLLAL